MNNFHTEAGARHAVSDMCNFQDKLSQEQVISGASNLPAIKFNSYSVLKQWLQDDLAESNLSAEVIHAANISVLGRLCSYAAILDSAEYAIYQQLKDLAENTNSTSRLLEEDCHEAN